MTDEAFMDEALREAERALAAGEVPVGAVIARGGVIVGRGHNEVESRGVATAHAEMIALERAARLIGDWRMDGCTAFVTVEPCHMCLGAFYLSRLPRIVFGARQPRSGACGSVDRFHESGLLGHRLEVTGGVRETESAALMQRFFEELRRKV